MLRGIRERLYAGFPVIGAPGCDRVELDRDVGVRRGGIRFLRPGRERIRVFREISRVLFVSFIFYIFS